MLTNARAKPGDFLVLTKPLGTGIATTGLKRGLTSRVLSSAVVKLMARVNDVGPELAERGLVRAATDITGFGLLGHLASMCRASGVSAEISADEVPVLGDEIFDLIAQDCIPGGTKQNLTTANAVTFCGKTPAHQRLLLSDAQTSGGLLLAVPPRKIKVVMDLLKKRRTPARAVVGQIRQQGKRLISLGECK